MFNLLKKTLITLLSVLIVIVTSIAPAYAAYTPVTKADKWQLEKLKQDVNKSMLEMTATRTGTTATGTKIKQISTIKVSPSASKLAKGFARGAGQVALGIAVADLIGKGVDWVLDPDNNQIKYKQNVDDVSKCYAVDKYFDNVDAASNYACHNSFGNDYGDVVGVNKISGHQYQVSCASDASFIITCDVSVKLVDKTLSLDTVAQRTKQLAEQGDQASQDYIKQIAQEQAEAGEYDSDFDANAQDADDTNTDDDTDNDNKCQSGYLLDESTGACIKKDTDIDTDEKTNFDLPAFCSWASKVCEFIDWVKEEPEQSKPEEVKQEEIELKKKPTDFDKTYIDLSDTCPTGFSFTIDIAGISKTVKLSMQPACDFAASVRPAIQFLGAFVSLGIISSAIRETA